jgi:cystathionine gamma-synthase
VKPALSAETLAAQALGDIDPEYGDLVPPIHPSTTYEFGPDGAYRSGRAYTRSDNPTYDHAERLLATLEGGAGCVLFASGNAAATAVFQSLLPGDHVLVARVLYWGVRKWLAEFALTWGLDIELVDTTDVAAVAAAIRSGRTRLVWLETPANPTYLIDRRASIRLEGGCQGCSLAEVTVRQGIERLVRAHCPEVIAVIDVTDHSAGTEPFYTPDKR